MPPSAASAFLDAMHESYSDPEEIVELDEPDVPTDEGEGEYSVWDGDELLAIFGDEYDADQFYEVAYSVAEYHGSGTGSLEVRHLTEEAMEQMDAEDGDVDFTDPANWE
jgi:hypothetical protein